MWFERAVPCRRYKVLGVLVGVCACAVLGIANSAALIDGQAMIHGTHRCFPAHLHIHAMHA